MKWIACQIKVDWPPLPELPVRNAPLFEQAAQNPAQQLPTKVPCDLPPNRGGRRPRCRFYHLFGKAGLGGFTRGDAELGADWPGGFYCPCHGSRFDLAGRVFKNKPAPDNLEVPPHMYLTDTTLLIGEDKKA